MRNNVPMVLPIENRATHAGGRFRLAPAGRQAKPIWVAPELMDWFEDMVGKIQEVSHGIFYGEAQVGGDEMGKWPKNAFRDALQHLRNMVTQGELNWPDGGSLHDPLDDIALAQRLIASDLVVDDAAQRVKEYADFRSQTEGGVMPSLEWIESGVALVPCRDRLGRPIVIIRPRYHRPGNIELFRDGLRTTLDALKAMALSERRKAKGISKTNPLEMYAMVWDFQGASWSNLDWEAFHCTLYEGAHHYPNMGAQIYVLNVSAAVRFTWSAASRLMHPRIRRKCLLVAPADVQDCMAQVCDPGDLPPEYGGTGESLVAPENAETLEDQVGMLLASCYDRAGVVPDGAKPLGRELSPGQRTASCVSLSPSSVGRLASHETTDCCAGFFKRGIRPPCGSRRQPSRANRGAISPEVIRRFRE